MPVKNSLALYRLNVSKDLCVVAYFENNEENSGRLTLVCGSRAWTAEVVEHSEFCLEQFVCVSEPRDLVQLLTYNLLSRNVSQSDASEGDRLMNIVIALKDHLQSLPCFGGEAREKAGCGKEDVMTLHEVWVASGGHPDDKPSLSEVLSSLKGLVQICDEASADFASASK